MYDQWKRKFQLISEEAAELEDPDENITEVEDEEVEAESCVEEFFLESNVGDDGDVVIRLNNTDVVPGSICMSIDTFGRENTIIDNGCGTFLTNLVTIYSDIDYMAGSIAFAITGMWTEKVVVYYDHLVRKEKGQ